MILIKSGLKNIFVRIVYFVWIYFFFGELRKYKFFVYDEL